MTLEASVETTTLVTDLTFAADFEGTPVDYFDVEPPPGAPKRFPTRRARVRIEDGRRAPRATLAREGFTLAHDPDRGGPLPAFRDAGVLDGPYRARVEALVARSTGARRVVAFDHTFRSTAMRARDGRGADTAVDQAHNDYSAASGSERVREALARFAPDEDPDRALSGRHAIVNVWRPLNGAVEQWPLALCDRRTLDPRDAVAAELRFAHRTAHIVAVRHEARQRWVYFPRMSPDEALVFACFDSAGAGGPVVGAHTAFDAPGTPEGARVRESLEVRTVALF